MAFRVLVGIDPGTTGAWAVFVDGELASVARLPVVVRKGSKARKGGRDLDLAALLQDLRALVREHVGAVFTAVVEEVGTFTPESKGKAGSNAVTTAKLAGIAGELRGALAALGFAIHQVPPRAWKKHHGLAGADKRQALTLAKRRHPWLVLDTLASADLAEAVLIGDYGVAAHGDG